jgi:hypothetical protein
MINSLVILMPCLFCGMISLYIIALNAILFYKVFILKKSNTSSPVLLVGGILGSIALFLLPPFSFKIAMVFPFLCDWGCMVIPTSLWIMTREKPKEE